MKKYLSYCLIVVTATMWGIISIFSKPLMVMGFSSIQIVFMRAFFSCVLLGAFIFLVNKSLFKIKLKDLPMFISAGIFSFVFCISCYMGSIDQNGAGVAGMLMYTSPIWSVIISSIIFNEKIGFIKIISLILVIIGVVMVCLGGEIRITLTGALLGVGSGLGCSFITIFSKVSANKNYSPITLQFYVFTVSLIFSFPLAKGWEIPIMMSVDYTSFVYFVLIAILCTVIPFVTYSFAIKGVSASTGGIFASFEVVVCVLTGFIVYNENIGVIGIVGIIIMLSSMTLLAFGENNKLKFERNLIKAVSGG